MANGLDTGTVNTAGNLNTIIHAMGANPSIASPSGQSMLIASSKQTIAKAVVAQSNVNGNSKGILIGVALVAGVAAAVYFL